jgi:hypothetical protein
MLSSRTGRTFPALAEDARAGLPATRVNLAVGVHLRFRRRSASGQGRVLLGRDDLL